MPLTESPLMDTRVSIVGQITTGVMNSVKEGVEILEQRMNRLIQASYFKTNDEMEREFSMEIAHRQMPVNRFDNLDGYINFRFPDDAHQGYMEENY